MAKAEFTAVRNEDGSYTVRINGKEIYCANEQEFLELLNSWGL